MTDEQSKNEADTPKSTETSSATDQPAARRELTAEEQMALYEQDLKENDWGHQPC